MVKYKELSEFTRLTVIELYSKGLSMRSIAQQIGSNHRTVGQIIKKKKQYGTVKNLPGRGRKSILTRRTKGQIVREVGNGSKITAKIIKENLSLDCSLTTIRRSLHAKGLWGRVASRTSCLAKRHMEARLKFAKDHIDKDEQFWSNVIWSDESKFELFGSKRRQTVWRRNGNSHKPGLTQPTVKHSKYVMVWGCFSAHGIGHLAEILGKLNAAGYKDIVEEHLHSSASEMAIPDHFILQQDNDPKHTSRLFKAYLAEKDIETLPWPSQSPDLNPIENLWDDLDRRVQQIKRKSFGDYKEALFRAWTEIPQETLIKLVRSMPKRLRLVIDAKGGPIKY